MASADVFSRDLEKFKQLYDQLVDLNDPKLNNAVAALDHAIQILDDNTKTSKEKVRALTVAKLMLSKTQLPDFSTPKPAKLSPTNDAQKEIENIANTIKSQLNTNELSQADKSNFQVEFEKLNTVRPQVKTLDDIEKLKSQFKNLSFQIRSSVAKFKGTYKAKPAPTPATPATPVEPSKPITPPETKIDWDKVGGELEDLPFERLEESTVLFKAIQSKTGLPEGQLKGFWELAKKKSGQKFQENDALFWTEVMKEFQTLVDKVDIEEARNIMETREKYKEAANSFLNNIAEDNYTQAEEAFKTMVSTRLDNNIAARAEKYCQEVLAREAQRLANDQ